MNEHRSAGAGPSAVPPPYASVMATIASQARRTNLVRVLELDAVLEGLAQQAPEPAGWAAAERTAHQLAGSAGIFGFDDVTALARSLESFLTETRTTGIVHPDRLARFRERLSRAANQLAGGPAPD